MKRNLQENAVPARRDRANATARDLKVTDRVYDQIDPKLLPLVSQRYV
ncbi:MAG: hypothetical protein AAF495_05060 [Pseudomonadota bacterium]